MDAEMALHDSFDRMATTALRLKSDRDDLLVAVKRITDRVRPRQTLTLSTFDLDDLRAVLQRVVAPEVPPEPPTMPQDQSSSLEPPPRLRLYGGPRGRRRAR